MVKAPLDGDLRIIMRQSAGGAPLRTSAGAPPQGTALAKLLKLEAAQSGLPVPISVHYDKALWSGLSWAAGEITHRNLKPQEPVTIRCVSLEAHPVDLQVEVYSVLYR